jgi:hypothetical protein
MAGLDRRRLARVLGMLGSGHDGEVLAAGRLVERLRQQAGATWDEILGQSAATPNSHQHDVETCLDNMRHLNSWEFDFLLGLAGFKQLSPQQSQKLAVIVQKVSTARKYEQQRKRR